jgi:glucosamine--fructose-6-phosphate aminotransferase (isomerizing)
VHNGIIENHEALRAELQAAGYSLRQPDRHRGDRAPRSIQLYAGDLLDAVRARSAALARRLRHRGGLRATSRTAWSVRARGQPAGGRASAPGRALPGLATPWRWPAAPTSIAYLEEGDVVDLQPSSALVMPPATATAVRAGSANARRSRHRPWPAELGPYRALHAEGDLRAAAGHRRHPGSASSGHRARTCSATRRRRVFPAVDRVLILACGTSYYAGCVARYWLESHRRHPCDVEIASEYRYRDSVPGPAARWS